MPRPSSVVGSRSARARAAWPAAIVLATALPACSGTSQPPLDASPPRDASVVDSTLGSDSGGASVDAGSDASALVDAATVWCGGACDPARADACADLTLVCRVDERGAACAPRSDAGVATMGDACGVQADCAPGLACFAQTPGLPGRCLEPCCAPTDRCGADRRCRGTGLLAEGTASPWHACLPPVTCDLAGREHPCATGEGCYVVDDVGTTECLLAGPAQPGAPCTIPNDCAPGSVCTGLTTRTCVQVCFLASTQPRQGCADGERCQAQAYSPPGTGICTPAI